MYNYYYTTAFTDLYNYYYTTVCPRVVATVIGAYYKKSIILHHLDNSNIMSAYIFFYYDPTEPSNWLGFLKGSLWSDLGYILSENQIFISGVNWKFRVSRPPLYMYINLVRRPLQTEIYIYFFMSHPSPRSDRTLCEVRQRRMPSWKRPTSMNK